MYPSISRLCNISMVLSNLIHIQVSSATWLKWMQLFFLCVGGGGVRRGGRGLEGSGSFFPAKSVRSKGV